MTALNEFQRLESTGIWRATPDAQRRDVIVSVGDATLVISDQKDTALSHWSLPAIERVNPGQRPAMFRPGADALETLELQDDLMIQAIAKVQTAIERRRPHPGRLRYLLVGVFALIFAALAFLWLPKAMITHTATVVPAATRLVIGHSILENIHRISGPPCRSEQGNLALDKLYKRLLGPKSGKIVILAGGVKQSEHLPGGIILLNRALVEDYEDPEVAAGFILAEDEHATQIDPLVRILQETGLISAFRLLTTGRIPQKVLDSYGEHLLTEKKELLSDQSLLTRFENALVRTSPYAYAIDISGETTVGLIEADPVTSATVVAVLNDEDWVGLQEICGE